MAKIKATRPSIDQAQVLEIASTIQQTIPYAGMNNTRERREAVERAAWLAFQVRETIESAFDDFDGRAFLLRCLDNNAPDKVTTL